MVERDSAVAVLGLGPVGRAFARGLTAAGVPVVAWTRDPARAAAAGGELGRLTASLEEACAAGTLLLCVSEEALAEVQQRILGLPAAASTGDRVALHPSGFLGPAALAPLSRAGWSTGKLHPLAPFPPGAAAPAPLRGAWCVVAGDELARARACELVDRVGGRRLPLAADRGESPEEAGRYHAAAALLAGGLAVLFEEAEALAAGAFEDAGDFRAALAELARATLANVERVGPRDALTGPVSRGSLELVAGHLRALAGAPGAASLYRTLGLRMAELALARGSIDAARREALATLLRS